jgi:elongator complex protein 2
VFRLFGTQFTLACQVKGHQDWIRALDFAPTLHGTSNEAVFLASSSQDKTIRVWKISRRAPGSSKGEETVGLSLRAFIDGPIFKAGENVWQVSIESLLLGHEDWVYSVKWKPLDAGTGMASSNTTIRSQGDAEGMCVLSASMDRSMMIWRPDAASGIWINEVTVGELAPSALGFYGGVWSPHGDAILANGYGGSLHLWKNQDLQTGNWQPQLTPSGHSASVVDFAWAKTGQFLISVSHDQVLQKSSSCLLMLQFSRLVPSSLFWHLVSYSNAILSWL